MSSAQPLSYSAAVGRNNPTQSDKEEGQIGHGTEAAEAPEERATSPTQPKTTKFRAPLKINYHAASDKKGPYTSGTFRPSLDHKPNTNEEDETAYVLTLSTTPEIHRAATDLRMKHFPRHLNKLSAHLTLFHALPGSKLPFVRHDLTEVAATQTPFKVSISGVKRLRHGVALDVATLDQAKSIHQELRKRWSAFLSKQDRGGFEAHYTIQNKVDDEEEVERTLHKVTNHLDQTEGEVRGLALYRYRKGYWDFEELFKFGEKPNID